MRKGRNIISLILSALLVLQTLPFHAAAEEYTTEESVIVENESATDTTQSELTVMYEDTERRGAAEKHFRLSDGSFVAASYPSAVHFENEAGEWEDIDNTLTLSEFQEISVFSSNDGTQTFTAENGDEIKSYAAVLRPDEELISIKKDSYAIGLSLLSPETAMELGDVDEAENGSAPDAASTPLGDADNEEETMLDPVGGDGTSHSGSSLSPEESHTPSIPERPGSVEEQNRNPISTVEGSSALAVGSYDGNSENQNSLTGEETPVPPYPEEKNMLDETSGMGVSLSDDMAKEVAAVVTNPDISEEPDNPGVPGEPGIPGDPGASGEPGLPGDSEGPVTIEEQVQPKLISSEVTYPNVWPGVDLKYENYGYNVKESIVVRGPQPEYRYSFILELDGLTPELQEDGSIHLRNGNGETVYYMPAPYMTDAKQQISYDVVYTLDEIETGYLLTVTADNTWIEDMERAYPVSIDPSMILYGGDYQGSITATCLTEGSNVTGAGGESLYIGHDSYGRDIQAFLQFGTLPTLPANCNVVSAVLGMYQHTYSAVGMNRLFLRAHEVNAATPPEYNSNAEWIRNMTWSTKPEFDEEDSEAYIRIGSGSNGAYQIWDISRIVSKWYENSASTRMLAIDAIGPESFSSTKYAAGVFWMNVGYTPVFLVYYRNNVGIEGRYTYQTASAGKAGSTYVGDYTAQLTVANTLLSSNSEVLPFSLTAYYNSPYRGRYFSADNSFGMHTADYSTMKLGSGWKLSVQESVVNYTVTTGDEPIEYYVYTDEDGTEHYFEVTPNQSTYQDDEGLGLTLSVSGTLYTIQDESENKKEFTNGYLTKLLDRNGNAIYYLYNDNTAYNSSNKFNPSSTSWKPKANQANRITQIIQINDNGSAADLPVLVCRFQYDGEFLSRITDAGGRSYTFTYQTASSGARLLSEIGFPGDVSAFYQYSSETHLLSKLYDEESQNGVELAYQNRFNNYFVQSSKAFMAPSVDGTQTLYNVWHSWSPTLQQRQYRFYGTDHESNTDDDIVTHYVFDIAGRTVNVIDHNTDRSKVLGASAASYTQNQGTQKTNNRLLGSASSGTSAVNLLQNNSMEIQPESSLEWSLDSGNTGGNGAFRSSVTEVSPSIQPRTGNYLLKMHAPFSMVSNTSEGGVVSEYQSVYLESGKTYVFSGYGNTRGMVSFGYNGGLTLSFQDNNGAVLAESDPLDYVTTATIESGWSRLQVSFTPETSGMYRVAANLKNAASYAAFDDFQLEEAPVDSDFMPEDKRAAASSYNLVQFGSLEKWDEFGADSSSAATYWTYDPSRASPIDSTDLDENRGYVMQIQGHPDAGRRAAQNIPVNRSSDTTYMLSAWGKAKSVTDCAQISEMEGDNSTYQRFFGMIAKLTYEDTSTPEYHYISFDPQYDGWQYTSGYIVPKRPGKVVKSIQISLAYDHNINTSWFDQISLTEEPAQTYTYDADGKLKTVTASGEMEDTYTYNGPDLTKFVSASSGTFDFEYDDNHNMTTATNDGLVLSAQYDEAGNNTSAKLQKGSAGAYMQSSATYTADGNHPLSVTDVDGLKTQYSYDSMGRVYSVLSPYEGGSISKTITYDSGAFSRSNGSFSSGTYALSDAFENGLLSRTARKTFSGSTPNWQKYEMTRDAGGNITRIQVQTARGADAETEADELWSSPIVLARYRYPLPNLPIEQTIFGNGDSENYLADDYYRVIGSQHWSNGELEYQEALSYDSNGNQAGSVVTDGDGIEIAEYSYEYDSLGRLIRSEQSGSSVGALRTQHQYDAQNRLCSQSWQLPGHEFWEVFTYNNQNGTMSSMEMGSGENVNYAHDSLLRLESVALEDVYEHRRNYMDGDLSGQQTSQIQYFNYYDPDGTTLKYGYRYLYDNGGKIQEVYYRENNEPLALENTFEYDKLGQLTSATGAFGNETYTYDTAGNLLTRTSGATRAQYTYDNPSWGDLLTAYQGQRIAYEGQSYDAENNTVTGTVVSGNPVSYYNGNRWDMEWIRGRLLFQATSDDISVTYTYDKNNLRSSKTVNGVEYSYTYAGDKLMRQSWAGNELYFFYDASGNPTALWYEPENGSTVVGYYMLDQQGDVVRMEDANGNVLASYSYDPWGKIISATGSLAEINPLRYRGYVYDQETGFYYLQSRYYDPAISRFLNADGYAVTGEGDVLGYNMFAYCNNDPINKSDTDGSRPVEVDEDPNRRLVATINPRPAKKPTQSQVTISSTKNPITNHVTQTHQTKEWFSLDGGPLIGSIKITTTATKADQDSALLYTFTDNTFQDVSGGGGIDILGWFGLYGGASSSNLDVFGGIQITPWVHGEVSTGANGIGAVLGVQQARNNMTRSGDIEITAGWGTILAVVLLAFSGSALVPAV